MAWIETKNRDVFTTVIQAFIFHSLLTRIGFVALILLVLWAQNILNMEDRLLLNVEGFDKQYQGRKNFFLEHEHKPNFSTRVVAV